MTTIATLIGVLLLTAGPAYAYIDPGAGSLIYQTVLAIVLGLGFGLRRSWASISRRLGRRGARLTASQSAEDKRE